MKKLFVIVLTWGLFGGIGHAQITTVPELKLPNKIYEFDFLITGKPKVIYFKSEHVCSYCDPDLKSSIVVFKDSKTMKILNQITGLNFTSLSSKRLYNGLDQEERKNIQEAANDNLGHHSVNWFLGNSEYNLEVNEKYNSKDCRIIKSKKIIMHLYHVPKYSFTEFTGTGSEVVEQWTVPLNVDCLCILFGACRIQCLCSTRQIFLKGAKAGLFYLPGTKY